MVEYLNNHPRNEVMTIGYLKRKGIALSELGQKYIEELSKYKDKALG